MGGRMIQLDPWIEVETPLGSGFAIMVIDYGMGVNTCWVVSLCDSGQIKHFESNDVKVSINYTFHVAVKSSTVNKIKT